MKKGVLAVFILTCFLTFFNNTIKAQSTTRKKINKSEAKQDTSIVRIEVKGMSCQEGCANSLDATFKKMPGIILSTTSYDSSLSQIKYDKSKISVKEIVAVIEKKGFTAKVMEDANKKDHLIHPGDYF